MVSQNWWKELQISGTVADSGPFTSFVPRITLFNWKEVSFKDWFLAVELKKAGLGFQKAYSFNGTLFEVVNNTIFMTGKPGSDYLMGETIFSGDNQEAKEEKKIGEWGQRK